MGCFERQFAIECVVDTHLAKTLYRGDLRIGRVRELQDFILTLVQMFQGIWNVNSGETPRLEVQFKNPLLKSDRSR